MTTAHAIAATITPEELPVLRDMAESDGRVEYLDWRRTKPVIVREHWTAAGRSARAKDVLAAWEGMRDAPVERPGQIALF